MKIKSVEIPRLGLRNIKTSLAVLLSFLVFRLIGREYPIYACIAAIICTKDTFKNSFEVSKDRIIGTIIGGMVGAVFLQVNSHFDMGYSFEIVASIGIMVVIYLCNLINEKGTVSLACVVFLLIMFNFKNSDSNAPYTYAFDRTLDTAIGVVISLVINRYLFPYNEQKKDKESGGLNLKIDSSTDLYCLIGNPVENSLSPEIHNMSFESNDINASYLAFRVKKEDLKSSLLGIKALGVKGINVTIPHKIDIIQYLDELDREAHLLGAVNTVANIDGKLKGFNTDGRGFVELLRQKGISLSGAKVGIIGAGGAARAIAISIGLAGASELAILNRTEDRGRVLADEIAQNIEGVTTRVEKGVENLKDYDLVINCTSVGMEPKTEDMPIELDALSKETAVADIVYKPLKTKLLREAEKKGHKIVEGLGMLINQAILSEEIWFQRDFEKEYIIEHFNKRFK